MIELSGSPNPPARPALPGSIVIRETADEVLDAVAADLLIQSKNCVRAFGDFHLAVSVRPETEPLLRRLMYDPALRDLPWKRTHLWMTDEAGPGDEGGESGFEVVRQLIVEQSDLPPEQAHAIRAGAPEADRLYEAELREHLAWREKGHDRLDFILMSLDEAGSAGGLRDAAVNAGADRLAVRTGPAFGVGLTLPMTNAARFIAVMVVGPGRGAAVQHVLQGLRDREAATRAPAARLRPLAGELRWYLDHAALPRP